MFGKHTLGVTMAILLLTACGQQNNSNPSPLSPYGQSQPQAQGATITYGQTVHGYVKKGATDLWNFVGTQGDSIGTTMQDRSNSGYPSAMVPMITLKDQNGNVVATGNYDPEIPASFINPATLSVSGTYTIEATAKNPGAYDLTLWLIQGGQPSPSLSPGNRADQSFFADVLTRLGIPVSHFTIRAMQAWQASENTTAVWNPLATTWKKPGSTNFNSVGVQNFADRASGVEATADTLALHYYDAIRAMLRGESFDRQGLAKALTTWSGAGAYVNNLINTWKSLWDNRGS